MSQINDPDWLESIITLEDGQQVEAVEQFTERMIALARVRLPKRLSRRVDPEDIVQSALNSFFAGNRAGNFTIKDSNDLWRLLSAITYHKVLSSIEFHGRQRRDVARDIDLAMDDDSPVEFTGDDATVSAVMVMAELLDAISVAIPETYQQILKLRLENYSIDEIADRVQVSSRTVNRAIEKIRTIAQQHLKQNAG